MHTLSEINVTPMLDLCFVLLVIFMITTPLLENNNELALPSGTATSPAADPDKVHTVAVDRNEAITLDGEAMNLGRLRDRLEVLHHDHPDVAVVIRPHKELTVQKLVGVMDALRAAQIAKVGIVTEQE
jgi:biopolymer transport protein ExbD